MGDPIHLELVAIGKSAVPVNLPSTLELGPFSLLDRQESEQNLGDGRIKRQFTLTIAAYEPGSKQVPAIEVTYLGPRGDVRTARTAPVTVKIGSLIANEPEPAIKDAAPPVTVMEENLWPAYIAGGLCAAGLGALLTMLIVRRLRARRGERPGPPPRPAHEVALEKLDRLGAYGFLENADNRPFYFAVSEIIREYLGGRYAFDSLELTTDELVAELRRQAGRGAGAGRDRGVAVGVRSGEVRQDLAERRRGARGAGERDPDRHRRHVRCRRLSGLPPARRRRMPERRRAGARPPSAERPRRGAIPYRLIALRLRAAGGRRTSRCCATWRGFASRTRSRWR